MTTSSGPHTAESPRAGAAGARREMLGAASRTHVDRAGEAATPAAAERDGARRTPVPRAAAAPGRTHIRPRHGWQAIDLGELWRTRDLLWIFTLRDIKVRYKQTFFGFAWALVVPLVQIAIFTVFFGRALGVGERVDEAAGRALPYPLFALTGQIAWNFFKMTVDGASTSLLTHAAIIRKIYVPRLVLPLSALGKPAMDTVVAFGLLAAVTAYYVLDPASGIALSPAMLLAPAFLAGSALPGLALGLLVAALTVSYRDLQHVMPFFTSTLFFVTPVIYSVDLLPASLGSLIYLNPVVGFVEAHRAAVMGLPLDWGALALSAALSSALLVGGLFYFTRAERLFADVA